MIEGSFQFGDKNSRDDWGIVVVNHDVLLPPKRSRKITIPGRSGQYDYGSRLYDERIIQIECVLEKQITKAQLREIAYALSEKRHLWLYNEPDKYYIAEIYDSAEVVDMPLEIMREFTLTFIAEPFAYGEVKDIPIANGRTLINYEGTAEAPCEIIIENPNNYAITGITIVATKKG